MDRIAECACGALRATTQGEPLMVGLCHCRACQRRTGTIAAGIAAFAKDRVRIEGRSRRFDRQADSGRNVRFHFCPQCGSSLYWMADSKPDWVFLASGAFADPGFPPPSLSVFEASRHAWLQLPSGIERSQGAIATGRKEH